MALSVTQKRSSLPHARAALAKGTLTVGFIGGSITETRTMYRSYSDHVINGLSASFPEARVIYQNAGIGATESTLGAFRVQGDLVDKKCDLIFVEFAVNDAGMESALRMETREGLVRQILKTGTCDVVFVYTYCQDMYEDMVAGRVPPSIADFETLAEHYGISSVWMGLHALNSVRQGVLRWEEWLPDQLHPNVAGSRFYAAPVLDFVIEELKGNDPTPCTFPAPLSAHPWEKVRCIPLRELTWKNPWMLRCVRHHSAYEETLYTSAIEAELTIPFEGTGIFLGMMCGTAAAAFDYRIDGGEWQPHNFERLDWMLESSWFHSITLAKDLPNGQHTLELRTKHANTPDAKGTRTHIALVGVFE